MGRKKILNPKTGRYVLVNGLIGQKILRKKMSMKKSYKRKRSAKEERCVKKVKKSLKKYKRKGNPWAICKSSLKKSRSKKRSRSRKRSGKGFILQPKEMKDLFNTQRKIAGLESNLWQNSRFIKDVLNKKY